MALYAWIKLSVTNSLKGRGVGLGLRTDSDEFESVTKPGAAPKWSQKGAKAKHDALLADVTAGDKACPTFAKSFRAYAHLHKQASPVAFRGLLLSLMTFFADTTRHTGPAISGELAAA